MFRRVRKTRTRNFREVELLVWLLILLVLFVSIFFLIRKNQKSYELHHIFLQDVNGLIVGSPINFMGVPVGHVTKLKMVNEDEVYVRFVIKDKTITLPKGTIANIEFSGLGGSRSIELYPPDPKYVQQYGLDSNSYIITAQSPRLRDSQVLLYDMFGKIGSILTRMSFFGTELQSARLGDEKHAVEKDVNQFIEFSTHWVDNIQKEVQNYKLKMDDFKKGKENNSYE